MTADRSDRTTQRARVRGDWKPRFIEAFREHKLITPACEAVGVGRTTVYDARRNDEEFAAKWAEVETEMVEAMEREAYRRAVEGVRKPLVSAGKHVTDVVEYSDGLLQFLLKARRPEQYRERHDINHSGRVDGTTKVEVVAVSVDRGKDVAELLAGINAAPGD